MRYLTNADDRSANSWRVCVSMERRRGLLLTFDHLADDGSELLLDLVLEVVL